ncbi:MAG: flagellar export protein FliJ [Desulfovermiculus sp.]
MKDFPLDSVLNYRKNLEDMAQLALGQARQEYRRVEQRILAEKEQLAEVRQALDARQTQGTDAMTLMLHQQYLERLGHNLQRLEQELLRMDKMIWDKKKALHTACTDKKKLEKLKMRHELEAQAEENRVETAQLDEVAAFRWGGNW